MLFKDKAFYRLLKLQVPLSQGRTAGFCATLLACHLVYVCCSVFSIVSLFLLAVLSLVFAEEQKEMEEDDPFTFDYHRLRVGGLILAAVLCLIGITILFSKTPSYTHHHALNNNTTCLQGWVDGTVCG
uniref:FXYD domain-containing ion transport regulator n=1 Tax=Esox lucius TaxID=8010 RepID=A0AAY5K5H3_ESOLU